MFTEGDMFFCSCSEPGLTLQVDFAGQSFPEKIGNFSNSNNYQSYYIMMDFINVRKWDPTFPD